MVSVLIRERRGSWEFPKISFRHLQQTHLSVFRISLSPLWSSFFLQWGVLLNVNHVLYFTHSHTHRDRQTPPHTHTCTDFICASQQNSTHIWQPHTHTVFRQWHTHNGDALMLWMCVCVPQRVFDLIWHKHRLRLQDTLLLLQSLCSTLECFLSSFIPLSQSWLQNFSLVQKPLSLQLFFILV